MTIPGFQRVASLLGYVYRNAITGLLEVGGVQLTEAHVADVPALLALSTTTYNNQSVIVDNPGGNVGQGHGTLDGIPARACCYNSAWHLENGGAVLGIYAEALQLTNPASTFTGLAVSDNGGLCKLTSAGVHGLSAANAITGANASKVRVLSGNNWTVGEFAVTAITLDLTGTDITINYPYSASLGAPTLQLAHATNEYELVRLRLPRPFTTRARFEYDGSVKLPVASAGAARLKFYLGSTGEDYSTAGLISNFNFTGASPVVGSFHGGIQLQNSRAIQKGLYNTSTLTGYGSVNSGDTANLTEDMTVSTDLIVTSVHETADRPFRFDSVVFEMTDA